MAIPRDRLKAAATRADLKAILAIVMVAVVARSAVAIVVPESPLVSDMAEYWERAIYIYNHAHLYENSWRMPGYPTALALAFGFGSGPSLAAARALNVLAGAMTALLTYWLARRTAGPRPSLVAAMAVACYPSLLTYTVFVATEAIVMVPIVSALIAASYGTRRAAVLAGVFAGLAALVRPAAIAVLPAVALASARLRDSNEEPHWSLRSPALVIAAFVLVMMPWWAHNARVYGRFIPLDTTAGLNLLVGNGPLATGSWDWGFVSRLQPEYLNGIDITTPAGSDAAAAAALAHISEDPSRILRLLPAKMAGLLAIEGREQAYAYSIGYFGAVRGMLVWMWGVSIMAAFPILVGVSVGGMAMRNGVAAGVMVPSAAFLAVGILMHAISFGDPRFHLPFVPVLAVLATGLARWRFGVVRWRGVAGVLLFLLLVGPWSTQLRTYWAALWTLAHPGGWNAHLSFDDLL